MVSQLRVRVVCTSVTGSAGAWTYGFGVVDPSKPHVATAFTVTSAMKAQEFTKGQVAVIHVSAEGELVTPMTE